MNESTSRLVTTHRARAPSSRPLSPFHRARRASRDRIDDRGTESTTEGLNESTIARANHTECDDFHAEPVHRPPAHVRVARNVRSFTSSPRSSRSSRSVVAVSRARRHSFHSHGVHACTSVDVGGDTRRVTTHQYHFSCLFPPQTIKKKKKVQHPRSKRTGYTRVMTHHRERDTYKKSHARGPMQSRSRGKKNKTQNTHGRG